MRPVRIALSMAALALAPAALAQQFVYNAGALPAQNIWTDGVVVADLDGDGDQDIVFANGSSYGGTGTQGAQPQHLFLNNGNGSFVAAHANLNTTNFNAKMVIAQDFDNDGDLDLFFASGSLGFTPRLLLNDGSAVFTDVSGSNLPALSLRSFCVCAGDVDNDGDLDVVINDGGTFGGIASQARLLTNDGTANFTDTTAAHLPVDLYNCQDISVVDVDGDLDVDILLNGKVTGSRIYVNDGTGNFTIATGMSNTGTSGTYEIDYADIDGDGDFDAAVQSIASFTEGWSRNQGNNTPWIKTNFSGGPNQDDNEMGYIDFDVDGDLDVIVGSLGSGGERIYMNQGNATLVDQGTIVQTQNDSTLDLALGDLNGDGRIDLVTAQGESGKFTNKVYFNNGPVDTLAPVWKQVETPASIGASGTVFRARVQDQMSDDGQIGVTMTYAWTTSGAGASSGSGTAEHMGGGLYRAAVPTNAGTTGVSIDWSATDQAGNTATQNVTLGSVGSPWSDLGGGLAGVSGIPALVGSGSLVPGSAGSLVLSNGNASSLSLLMVSIANNPTPFKGGTVITIPITFSLTLGTSGAGGWTLPWTSWPTGLPSGFQLYFQALVQDAAAVKGTSISNGLQATTP